MRYAFRKVHVWPFKTQQSFDLQKFLHGWKFLSILIFHDFENSFFRKICIYKPFKIIRFYMQNFHKIFLSENYICGLIKKKVCLQNHIPPLSPYPRPCNLLQGCPLFGINRVGWAKIHCEHILLDWLRQCRWIYRLWHDFEEWTYQFCWSFLIFEINEKGASASTSMWGL